MPTTATPSPAVVTVNVVVAPVPPRLVILATHKPDPEVTIVRPVQVFRSREPEPLKKSFDDVTHARALLQAVGYLVDRGLRTNNPIRVVMPDKTVVDLLRGREHPRGRHLSEMVACIRDKVGFRRAQVTFEFGYLHTLIGQEAVERLDLW